MTNPSLRFAAILGVSAAVLAFSTASYADNGPEHKLPEDRPIMLGVSGGSIEHVIDGAFAYCYAGTLGSLVQDGDGNQYILSNNHVLAKENDPNNQLAPDGRNIIQPGLLDEGTCTLSLGDETNIVGKLADTDYVEILFGRGRNPPENFVDAAMALTNDGSVMVTSDDGFIRDIGVLTGDPVGAVAGAKVQKSGRTTGHTFGEVVATGVRIKVGYQNGTALFVDQIEVVGLCGTDFSAGGDSGSLIVNLSDGNEPRAAVGLLFAGGGASTFANPIGTVLSELGEVTMVHNGSGNLADTGLADTDNPAIPSCSTGGETLAAGDDSYKLPKKQDTLTVAAPGVLDNDTGYVGAPLLVVDPERPTHGEVTFNGDGGFTYDLFAGGDRNALGSDSFVYKISDGTTTATATVTINLASKGGGKPSSRGVSGAFGLDHALQVRADHENELLEIPGVMGTGIGTDASGKPVIRIYVEKAAQSVDHPIPANIEGVRVRVVVTGTIKAY